MKAFLVVVGSALLILALVLLARRLFAMVRGVTAIGRVQGHEKRTMDDDIGYLPIVEFTDLDGNVHRFTSVAGRAVAHPKVGAEVRVRYVPSRPGIVYIQSFLHMWAAPLACFLLGIAAWSIIWRM